MVDIPNNNFKKPNEVLDLRTNVEAPRLEPDSVENLPDIENNEQFDNVESGFEETAVSRERKSPSIPGGIIADGQNRALSAERQQKIENILAEGLDSIYIGMDPQSQIRFKATGEQATRSINDLIAKGKCTLKAVLIIIKNWLNLIPGVNRFFLEQEAKIKADKIMNIQKNYG